MQITITLQNQDLKNELLIPAETRILLHIMGNTIQYLSPYIYNSTYFKPNDIEFVSPCCSPVENKDDLELDFKVFFFTDSCCSDIVHDESK